MKQFFSLLAALVAFSGVGSAAITENGSYALDKDHAHVGFLVTHLGISKTVGRFNDFSGEFTFVANGDSSVDFTVQVESVDTNSKRRDKHLKSDDFFDVDSFETMTFKSSAFTYSEGGDPVTITGDLNLHGVKKSVTFAVDTVGAGIGPSDSQRAGYTAKTTLKRSEFGMDQFAKIVGDDVEVTVNLEIIKN